MLLIKNIHYITKNLKERFNFDPTVKSKPVSDIDSLALALSHHWRRDTSMFPSERQRLQVPAVFLLCAGTGARPGEFVDASVPNPNQSEVTNNPNFQEGNRTLCKALCSEDVRIFLIRDEGKRPALAMDVRLAHHKGVNNRPKP